MSYRIQLVRGVLLLLALTLVPAARASAQNLTVNPHFDGGTAAPWTGTFGFDATVDDTGTAGSGSGKASIVSSDGNSALIGGPSQCFVISPGATYTASENVFISSVNSTPDVAILGLFWFTNSTCNNAGFINNNIAQTATPNAWVPLSLNSVVPPAGTNSVLVAGELEWFVNGTHTANFDDILLSAVGGVPAMPPLALVAFALLLLTMAIFAMLRPGFAR